MINSIEQKRRELFEAWWRVHKGHGEIPARYAGGQYIRDSALWAWIGFNAALDAVVVTLPEPDMYFFDGESHWADDCYVDQEDMDRSEAYTRIDAFRAAIESTGLGLKVK